MKAIIYGANGYIGFHLTNTLLHNGHEVLAIVHESTGHLNEISQKNLTIIDDKEFLSKSNNPLNTDFCNYDILYHLAWAGSCGKERSDALLQLKNVELAVSILVIAEKIKCKKIIFIGTIYEKLSDEMLKQQSFNNNAFYILAKKHSHELTLELSKKMNIKYIWCNLCHPLGKYMLKTQFMPSAIDAFLENKETAFDSCKIWYDIYSVNTLANQLSILGEKEPKENYYYLGSGNPKLSCDYLTIASKLCDYKLEIGFNKLPENPLSFEKEWFSTTSFETEFNYKNTEKFEDVVREYKDTL
ncbi:MAG: NAD-dependent epimerase/dehydratase family protein [Lachnospiraceae bacterium]|nr:NAD-dependent epimerase/dehydratase family protein [Lachnospiraceae bacterium]